MKFTQFLHPNARRQAITIDMRPEIEGMAAEIQARGYRFEIECFPDTQIVHMDCSNDDGPLAIAVCYNGPKVPECVADIVRDSWASLNAEVSDGPADAPD